jgi:cell division protein FtsI/penicillin-binding protein 2
MAKKKSVRKILNKNNVILLVLILLISVMSFIFIEMKQLRKDLYGIRSDYYGEFYQQSDDYDSQKDIKIEILSQEVQNFRLVAYYDQDSEDNVTEDTKVRVLKTRIKNTSPSDNRFIYVGNFGYVNESGVMIRSINIQPEEDLNIKVFGSDQYSDVTLAPGGEIEMYLYFRDSGRPIGEIISITGY